MREIIKEGQMVKFRNKNVLLIDMSYHSHIKGVYLCDFCGDEFERKIRERNYTYEKSPYDSCGKTECARKKREISNILKYGTKSPAESEEIKQKMIETFRKNHGVDNPMFVESIVKKIAETKVKNGTDKFYGGLPRINGVFASFPQINLSKKINGKVNYLLEGKFVDIVLEDEMIAIEYDGSGHTLSIQMGQRTEDEFYMREENFVKQLLTSGWRLIRIINEKDELLNYDEVIEKIDDFILADIDYLEIVISKTT